MSERAWHLVIAGPAGKQLNRLPPRDRARLTVVLDRLGAHPAALGGDVKKLEGAQGIWRLRVGDWRVRFRRDETTHTIVVTAITPRGRAYRG